MRVEAVPTLVLLNCKKGGPPRGKAPQLVRRKQLLLYYFEHQQLPGRASGLATGVAHVSDDDSVFKVVNYMSSHDYLLVRDRQQVYTHIVTPRALADYWVDYARPFQSLEVTERAIRGMLASLGPDWLERATSESTAASPGKTSVDSLNPRDYAILVDNHWDRMPHSPTSPA